MATVPNDHNMQLTVFHNKKSDDFVISENCVVTIKEHLPCRFKFSADDPEARLYLPGLDIATEKTENGWMPFDSRGWKSDGDTTGYREANVEFDLFQYSKSKEGEKGESNFVPLRVGTYDASVKVKEETIRFTIEVAPNEDLLNTDEWKSMLQEVESERVGLARDIVRQSVGLYDPQTEAVANSSEPVISTEQLYRFMVLRAYNEKVLAALLGIQKSPKNRVVTQYVELPVGASCRRDPKSVQMTAVKGKVNHCVYSPKKFISYDIPENRLLKKIIGIYDRELTYFLELIRKIQNTQASTAWSPTEQGKRYMNTHGEELKNFQNLAEKLRKTTYVIKSQRWYQDIPTATAEEIPHSFAMDPRYGVLLRMYQDLRQEKFQCRALVESGFSWKTSYDLYEMWCYLKLYRMFLNKGWTAKREQMEFKPDSVFPVLSEKTAHSFSRKRKNRIEYVDVFYNHKVPCAAKAAEGAEDAPLRFWDDSHPWPDLRIDLYTNKNDEGDEKKYWGSLILDCKYRTKESFWDGQFNCQEQLMSYYTKAVTPWIPNHGVSWPDYQEYFHPVKKVIILTPDGKIDNESPEPNYHYLRSLKLKSDEKEGEKALSYIVENFIEAQLDKQGEKCYWTKPV